MSENRITVNDIRNWPKDKPLLDLTAYDYSTARILDEAGVDIIHVGDSLGMVMLGYPDTTSVTMSDMIRATESVARARKHALLTADLCYGSYDTAEDAVRNSRALIEAGADAVKMEGGVEIIEQIRAVRAAGIEIQGHLGMLPQRVKEEGGYKRKGKTEAEVTKLREDVLALNAEGVFSIVLEVVVGEVAAEMSRISPAMIIGIASGKGTRGQVRVIHDVVGLYPWFVPAHSKPVVQLHEQIKFAVEQLRRDISQVPPV